jgi:hypothetical protein
VNDDDGAFLALLFAVFSHDFCVIPEFLWSAVKYLRLFGFSKLPDHHCRQLLLSAPSWRRPCVPAQNRKLPGRHFFDGIHLLPVSMTSVAMKDARPRNPTMRPFFDRRRCRTKTVAPSPRRRSVILKIRTRHMSSEHTDCSIDSGQQ